MLTLLGSFGTSMHWPGHGNFGRAAEECAISQPAISMRKSAENLEHELGVDFGSASPRHDCAHRSRYWKLLGALALDSQR